ncbi:AfsR/SARP family transcriptional regulator [Streptomyces boninensis]|uniref:AfsR/SARP family transcriptional regulator n=1 Tax=Streptomyces boninensis TaxID=2039455 RepID=UPI003B21EADC
MRYRILGPTQALTPDGGVVALGGARLRALLAALALEVGRVRSAEVLIGEVWAVDEPPADAAGALQALVGRLRRALGHDAVDSLEGGYRLAADRDDVDLYRFARLADEGSRALADGDPDKAATLCDDALSLWRGPALADLPDRAAPATRWEARRLDTRRDRAAAALALGEAETVLPDLRALTAAHPLDEPLHALHLRALRDAGRTAEALAAYEQLRTTLADTLGADPGPELRALHAELLGGGGHSARPGGEQVSPGGVSPTGSRQPRPGAGARDRAPGPGRGTGGGHTGGPGHTAGPGHTDGPGRPGGREADPGRGSGPAPYDTSGDRAADAAASASAPAPHDQTSPPAPPPGNLRARLTSFVGREADIDSLGEGLAVHRLVTLTGPGGAGKTRLAQEAAEAAQRAHADERWVDGVWLVELAPIGSDAEAGAIADAVLGALGARETVLRTAADALRTTDPMRRLAEHCARRRILLVLDNCEHVIGAAAEVAEQVLISCAGVTVLATSREPLAVPGEVVRPVDPLPDAAALRLLAERGAAARPGFVPQDDPAACAEICHRLDGLPLAIELAAARLRMLTPRQLADRLDDRFRLLTSGSRTLLPRQQTLRAVVDWSWDLLDERERAVLSRLSVFHGGCDLAAAEAVCAGPEASVDAPAVDRHDILGLLGSLVDKSLVIAAPTASGEMRYRLLETVREYAGERLAAVPAEADAAPDATAARHLTYYRELARTADPQLRGSAQREWLDRLQLEHDNLRAALRRAIVTGDEQEALSLVHSLMWFWTLLDLRTEARTWALAAADLGPNPFVPTPDVAPPVDVACVEVPPPYSDELLQEARRGVRLIALSQAEGDMEALNAPDTQAELRGVVAAYHPDLPQTCRLPGFMWFYAGILTGAFQSMLEIFDTAVRTCRVLDRDWELAFALQLRAKVLNDQPGGLDQSAADAAESLEIFERLGDGWGMAESLATRGEARERYGEHEAAARDYEQAIAYTEALGAHAQIPMLAARLGGALIETGRVEDGERLLRQAVTDAERSATEARHYTRMQLAVHCARIGRTDEAREHFRRLEDGFATRGPELFTAIVQGFLGWVDVVDGRCAEALPRIRRAVTGTLDDPMAQLVAPNTTVTQFVVAAWALAGLDRAADGARLLGAFDALSQDPSRMLGVERENRARAEAAVRAGFAAGEAGEADDAGEVDDAGEAGDAAFRRAYEEGRELTAAQATELI